MYDGVSYRKGICCPCGHAWMFHDIEEWDGDGSDLCCVEGCDQKACPGKQSKDEIEVGI